MCKRVQVCDRRFVSYPHPFLPRVFEAGIVTFTFRAERTAAFKIPAVPVDGKPQVVRNCNVSGTATMLFAIIKVFMMAKSIFGRLSWTAELLAGAISIRKFTILPHGKSCFTDGISLRKKFGIFRIAFV